MSYRGNWKVKWDQEEVESGVQARGCGARATQTVAGRQHRDEGDLGLCSPGRDQDPTRPGWTFINLEVVVSQKPRGFLQSPVGLRPHQRAEYKDGAAPCFSPLARTNPAMKWWEWEEPLEPVPLTESSLRQSLHPGPSVYPTMK